MAMIDINDIELLIPLARNLDSKRINSFADQVENVKGLEFLGRELYSDILDNPDTPENTELIDRFRPVLIYWTYINYIEQGQFFNTATGIAVKRSDASLPLSDTEMDRVINRNCKIARMYESELYNFMKENADDYPLWRDATQHTGCEKWKIAKTETSREI